MTSLRYFEIAALVLCNKLRDLQDSLAGAFADAAAWGISMTVFMKANIDLHYRNFGGLPVMQAVLCILERVFKYG